MAVFMIEDSEVLFGPARLTCQSNTWQVNVEVDELDATTLCSAGWRTRVAGLHSSMIAPAGFADHASTGPDGAVWDLLGSSGPVSVVPDGAAVGDAAYLTNALYLGGQQLGGQVGELSAQGWTFAGKEPMARGVLALVASASAVTVTGSDYQLGAVTASQRIWAAVHATSLSGSWVVTIESDDNSGFSSPTTRITFDALTGAAGQWSSAVGAITDTYWRAILTRTSGTATAYVTFGIK